MASFIRRRIQPLMAWDHLGFEYTGPEDSSRVVPKEELAESEVLGQVQKLLKGVTVMPLRVEYNSTHPPPAVSFSFLLCFELFFLCLY